MKSDEEFCETAAKASGCGLFLVFVGALVGAISLCLSFGAHVGFAAFAIFCIAVGLLTIFAARRNAKNRANIDE